MAASANVRMYNQLNLGDCFLLRFSEGRNESFVLIDFGSYERGNEKRELEIANSIKETVGDKPLIIVLTHQHKDHLSGFISAEPVFRNLNVSEVWLSYLDDPIGKEAKAMRALTEKFWNKNKEMKEKARARFGDVPVVEKMLNAKDAMDQFSEDLFAEGQTGGKAITNLLKWSKKSPAFLLPGSCFDLPGLPGNTVKVYVLGPPTNDKQLRKMEPSKGDAVESLQAMPGLMNLGSSTALMLDALNVVSPDIDSTGSEDFPFNKKFNHNITETKNSSPVKEQYLYTDTWRQIDHAWLSEMGRISLHMGNITNNTSLVLAFELVEQRKVMLFAADAQIGNWKSWLDLSFDFTNGADNFKLNNKSNGGANGNGVHKTNANLTQISATDLLSRTVLYKAGHHSSHNATLAESLDLMNEEELVIMIPVNEEVSTKMKFTMLRQGMLKGYNRKSHGRVLRSDTIYHNSKFQNAFKFPFAATDQDFESKLKIAYDNANETHIYLDYKVE